MFLLAFTCQKNNKKLKVIISENQWVTYFQVLYNDTPLCIINQPSFVAGLIQLCNLYTQWAS